jgi:PAS domain S-box-containing protein
VHWENVAGVAADARECAFRLGALTALLRHGEPARDFEVRHSRCRARGDDACVFGVEGLVARADPRHARLFAEASRLAAALAGREALWRRLASLSARSGPFPDVQDIRGVRRFIEELEAPVLVFDRSFAILDANRAALRMAGMSLDELRGLSARDLLDTETFRRIEQWRPRLLEAGALRGLAIEGRFRERSVALEVSARVSGSGETIVAIARDVSEHRRLERELAARNRELREQNARMGEADRLKSEFLANISHELTTPLTAIKGFAKLLLGDFTAELSGGATRLPLDKRFEFVAIVQQEAERMTELIRGLLELSKIESGVVSLDRSTLPLNRIVKESLLVLKPRLEERSLTVEATLDPALPLALLDPDRIKQVVLNLLDNAIKFSTPGARIDVTTSRSGDALVLAVTNPSHELEPTDLDRIFDRFVQRDGSFARAYGGVGLGLNLVRGIVLLHGGRVRAELPEPGRFRVVVELPV